MRCLSSVCRLTFVFSCCLHRWVNEFILNLRLHLQFSHRSFNHKPQYLSECFLDLSVFSQVSDSHCFSSSSSWFMDSLGLLMAGIKTVDLIHSNFWRVTVYLVGCYVCVRYHYGQIEQTLDSWENLSKLLCYCLLNFFHPKIHFSLANIVKQNRDIDEGRRATKTILPWAVVLTICSSLITALWGKNASIFAATIKLLLL